MKFDWFYLHIAVAINRVALQEYFHFHAALVLNFTKLGLILELLDPVSHHKRHIIVDKIDSFVFEGLVTEIDKRSGRDIAKRYMSHTAQCN